MTPEQINIKIAEACGWRGVPVQQQWLFKSGVKYWRSLTPEQVLDVLPNARFDASMIARWLQQPDGSPFVLRRQAAGIVNHHQTYRDNPVVQHFDRSEWPENARGWEFQTNPWPSVEPSLAPFVKHLPNYCADLNAMHEAEKVMDFAQCNRFTKHLRSIGDANAELMGHEAENFDWHSTAMQRAEAFLRALNKWEEAA